MKNSKYTLNLRQNNNMNIFYKLCLFLILILVFGSKISAQNNSDERKLHNISLYVGANYNKVGDLQDTKIKVSSGIDYEYKLPGLNNLGIGLTGMASFVGDVDIFGFVPIYVYSNNQKFKFFFAPGIANYKGLANKINYLPNQTFPDEFKQITAIAYRVGVGYEINIKKINLNPRLSFDFYDKFANVNLGITAGYKF